MSDMSSWLLGPEIFRSFSIMSRNPDESISLTLAAMSSISSSPVWTCLCLSLSYVDCKISAVVLDLRGSLPDSTVALVPYFCHGLRDIGGNF